MNYFGFVIKKSSGHFSRVLGLVFLLNIPIDAQIQTLEDSWRWAHFTQRDGLPHPHVYSLVETVDGTTWAGTFKGLAWYDGYLWHGVGFTAGLPEVKPHSMFPRPEGGLFALIKNRLYVGDQDGFKYIQTPFEIDSAASFSDGSLLLLSEDKLHHYRNSELVPFPSPSGLAREAYIELSQTLNGNIWLRSVNALYRLEGTTWVIEQSGRTIDHITEDSSGRRFGSVNLPVEERGLWMWNQGSAPQRYAEGMVDLIELVAASAQGQLIAVYESGDVLVRWEQKWSALNPLPEQMRHILSAGFCANGDLWVGSEKGLFLHRSSAQMWTQWKQAGTMLRNRVDEILTHSDGSVWLGTDGGIEIHRPDGAEEWVDRIGATDLRIITGLAEDSEGQVWISSGAQGVGAYRWDGQTWTYFGPDQGLVAQKVHRIHRDRHQRLWFLGLALASAGNAHSPAAVYVYHNGKFSPFPLEKPLGDGRVYSFAEGPDGALWFGTIGGLVRLREGQWTRWTKSGSTRLQEGQWTPLNTAHGLKVERIFALAVGNDGRLWFTDQHQGLGYIDSEDGPTYLTTEDGLIHNEIWDLEFSADGVLWLATRGGLSSYRDGIWSHFGPAAGIKARELWPISVSRDRLYIGTAGEGTYMLQFGEATLALPRVEIAAPLLDRNRAVFRWRPSVYWGQQPSEQTKTRYRLDRGPWSAWSHQREVTIDGLGSGTHTFQAQAASQFGLVSTEEYSRSFTIPPPFYQQPIFLVPVGSLVVVVIVLVIILAQRRRRHSAALSASEARYRSFFEEAQISLWEHDFSAVKEYLNSLPLEDPRELRAYLDGSPSATYQGMQRIKVLALNHSTLKLFGAKDHEELLANLVHIFRRDSIPTFKEGLLALAENQTHFNRETLAYDLTGQRLNLILDWSVVPGHEQTLNRVLVTVLDVTPQRQAAEKMRRSMQAAEEANRVKGEFMANMSHEIRTPMNAIIGLTELALSTELTSIQRDYLQGVDISAKNLLILINGILDLAKIEAGKMSLERVDLSLRDTLDSAMQSIALPAEDKGLELSYRLSPDVPDPLVGDPVRLEQILTNLLSNAVKFTEQGEVVINIGHQMEGQNEVSLHLEVRDTGIGIPKAKQEEIFEAFTQADGSTTRQYGGTGLGLSITSQLVGMMGGRIWLESEEGKGSSFHLIIKFGIQDRNLKPASPTEIPPEAATLAPLPPLRILLAEDNKLNQMVAVALLKQEGHSVVVAGNGQEALDILALDEFDAVLMDVQMPEMDGLEATAAIRKREESTGAHIPIVALTAHAMTGDREECLDMGMDDYVTKPVNKDQLYSALADLVVRD